MCLCVCVSAQSKYPALCVTHKQDKFCNWNNSNAFSCSYTANLEEISVTGWSFKPDPDKRMHRDECTLKAAELESCNASVSDFTKVAAQTRSHCTLCTGLSRRRFLVLASPVSIVVERLIQEHDVMVASWTVRTGQRIRLTCVPTCASDSGPDRGHIWYRDSVRLPASAAGSSRVLSLDPVGHKHQGSYVCALAGHEISPSSPVRLTVLTEVRPIHSDKGPSPTNHLPEENPIGGWSSVSLFSTVLVVGVCAGLVAVTAVVIVAWRQKRTKEGRQRRDSVPSRSSSHGYTALDVSSKCDPLYETVGNVQRCAAACSDYENLNGCGMKDKDRKAVASTDHRAAATDARSRTPGSERPSAVW